MILDKISKFKRGGVHPPENKTTADIPLKEVPLDGELYVSLLQGLGKQPIVKVKKNDKVLRGQLIAESAGFISYNLHAPTSGTVKDVTKYPHPNGGMVDTIVIAPDDEDKWDENLPPALVMDAPSSDLIERIRWAGILGLGGAAFPSAVKLSPPPETKIDYVLLNGAECEPVLTSDHCLMLERPEDVSAGLAIFVNAVANNRPKPKGIICIEDNKRRVAERINEAAKQYGVDILLMKTRYPQGAEKQLIEAATGRKLKPRSLPMTVGVIVQNVATACSATDAVLRGKPLDTRIVTVAGDAIANPGNYLVRLGTPIERVVKLAGGITKKRVRIILGGPMMGMPTADLRAPFTKGAGGLLVFSAGSVDESFGPCIRCSRCVEACPLGLFPNEYGIFMETDEKYFTEAMKLSAGDCFECGSCTYVCPAKRPLVQWIKRAKMLDRIAQAKTEKKKV